MSVYSTALSVLARLPGVVTRPQDATDWTGEYPVPSKVLEYYRELGPVDAWIASYGNAFSLPCLANLWAHQTGYRTHGFTGERLIDWEDDWLVIADQGGDPFIFSRSTGTILHAFHGEGVWEPDLLFDDLPQMATSLAILGDVVESAGREFTDDSSLIRPKYLNEARSRLTAIAGGTRADAILARLEWTWDH